MRANFPAGRLHAEPCFLAAVPRSAMISAIVSHFTQEHQEGAIRSNHSHEGHAFTIETTAGREQTHIRMEG